jgi:hypothetical protein
MSASAHRYSCEDLGVCQSRNTPCSGCSAHPFAPGAIEHHSRQRCSRTLRRWLARAALFLAFVGVLAFAAGLTTGFLQ